MINRANERVCSKTIDLEIFYSLAFSMLRDSKKSGKLSVNSTG